MRKIFTITAIFLFTTASAALPPEQLQNTINDKARQLKEINEQIEATYKSLAETEERGRSLKQELRYIDSNLKQLNLGIQSSEITIEKLNLEIEFLQNEIKKKEGEIQLKKEAIDRVIKELQVIDEEDPLVIFLRGKTLADGISESQSLADIKDGLSRNVEDLQELRNELNQKLDDRSTKKIATEREQKNLQVRKSLTSEERGRRSEILKDTQNQEKLYQKQIEDLADKQAQIAEEIEDLESDLRSKINTDKIPPPQKGLLSSPVQPKRVTQGYGKTKFARYGYRGHWHNGLDFGGPIGTPILAPYGGIVIYTGDQDRYCRRGAYGKYIVIKHPNNLVTLYAHLSRIAVEPGNQVERGSVIGYMGSTGYSTGPHLHFTVYDSNTFRMTPSRSCGPMPTGGDINPENYT